MENKNPLLTKLLEMTEPDLIVLNSRVMRKFLGGSRDASEFLCQLLFWTPRARVDDGYWIAKSDKEFQDELGMTRYGVRAARKSLLDRGLIESKNKKFNNAPTQHYHVKIEVLEKKFIEFVRLSENEQSIIRKRTIDYANSDNTLSENSKSLTEITQRELQRKQQGEGSGKLIKSGKASTTATPVLSFYENEFGEIKSYMKDKLDKAVKDYSEAWVLEAMGEAVSYNKKNWRYAETILERWKKEGKEKNIQPKNSQSSVRRLRYGEVNLNHIKTTTVQEENPVSDATRAAAKRIVEEKRKRELQRQLAE